MTDNTACENTDREIWRGPDEGNGSFYADSIHVTQGGGIGIDCGGHVIVKPLRDWHTMVAREQHAQSVLAAIRKVRDEYADQAKFADIEAVSYFREFIRRLDEAVSPKTTSPPWGGRK